MSHPELPFPPNHFTRTQIKSGDKVRAIDNPDEEARQFHANLLERLYGLDLDLKYATGGVPGKSLVDNISPHIHGRTFYTFDAKNAFPSVQGDRLTQQLVKLGVFESTDEARSQLHEYCLNPDTGGLPLGAPCSPYLFNIYCMPLDEMIGFYCRQRGLTYTRYFDDLTISAPGRETLGKQRRKWLRDIVRNFGFEIAHHKSKLHSLENGPVTITGLSLYRSGHWKLSPGLVERVIAAFDDFETQVEAGVVTDHHMGVLHGYHGVLTTTFDPSRGQPTPLEQQLRDRYQELRQRARALLGGSAVVGSDTL